MLEMNNLIEEQGLECRPEKVSSAIIDENVDVHNYGKEILYL